MAGAISKNKEELAGWEAEAGEDSSDGETCGRAEFYSRRSVPVPNHCGNDPGEPQHC